MDDHGGHAGHAAGAGPDLLLVLGLALVLLAAGGYVGLALGRVPDWPRRRTASWLAGCVTLAVAIAWPGLHSGGFAGHVVGHLLLGMLAPLLLVLAAPVTLAFRALPVAAARRLGHLLGRRLVRFLTEPVVAATLNVGGLWLVYTSGVYPALAEHRWLALLVHLHMFAAGYLFTAAIVSVDPLPHRRSHLHRAVVLVLALAAHDVLAKYLYAHPPAGIGSADAETGAMIMYYGGDAVDLILMVLLCARWYRDYERVTRLRAKKVRFAGRSASRRTR